MAASSMFTAPMDRIDPAMVRDFLADQAAEHLLAETTVLEFKREISGTNVVKTICAMANTDGGLIILGVDEARPDQAPGVSRRDQDRLINQCRTHLQPLFYPDVTIVPADDPELAIVVIRVEPQPALWPMLCQSVIYVRAPGSTVPARRDEVVALVRAQSSYATAGIGDSLRTLQSAFYLDDLTQPAEGERNPDLRVRVASGLYMRSSTSLRQTLAEPVRRLIRTAVDESTLARWVTGVADRSGALSVWRTDVARAAVWRQHRSIKRRSHPQEAVIAIEARVEGLRLSWAVDVDIYLEPHTEPREGQTSPYVIGAADLTRGWIEAIKLVADDIPRAVIQHTGLPPLADPEVVLWTTPTRPNFWDATGLSQLPREVPARHKPNVILSLTNEQMAALELALLEWWQHELLDDGVTGAGEVAADILRRATEGRPERPWI